jgi:cytochrome c556
MTPSLLLAALLTATPDALAGKKDKAPKTEPAAAPAAPAAPAAQGPAKAAYDYRHEVFESLGKHMKSLSFFAKGTLEPRTPDLVAHATAIHQMSTLVPALFPAGSGPDAVPETEALASIWTDPAGFAARSEALQTESAALVEIAKGGDIEAFKAQLGKVGGTCGACHDGFRKDDD